MADPKDSAESRSGVPADKPSGVPAGKSSSVEQSSSVAGQYSGASALAEHRDSLEKHEFMLGAERGRLAVSLDMLTDALILIGQHGVYCVSSRNPTKPALDLQTVLDQINGAKQLIQSTMSELERKRDAAR